MRSIFAFVDLSVIIVSYNVKHFLEHCLLSVIKAGRNLVMEIFVVDNKSEDKTKDLEKIFPTVKFYWKSENIGFAKANNSALSVATGNHILFLNPDTIIPEDCFHKCLRFFRTTPDCGALGVRMVDGQGQFLRESKRSLPGIFSAFYKAAGLSKLFPHSKKFSSYYAGHLPENVNNPTEVLAGAFMMLSRKAITITGGFDEKFFMYGEDVDLSYRILEGNMKNYYFAETTILHFKGESTVRDSKKFRKYFYGAMRLFAKKHYSKILANYLLLKAGIAVSESLAALTAYKKVGQKTLNQSKLISVLGNDEEFDQIKILLNKKQEYILQHTPILPDLINAPCKFESIIFCSGLRSYKENIEDLQKLPMEIEAMFYAHDVNSIIGSTNKHRKGFFIAEQ